MVTINLAIPDDQINRVKTALIGLFPIPTEFNEQTEETVPMFTENQWAKECLRRWLIQQVKRYEEKVAKENLSIAVEDTLVQ